MIHPTWQRELWVLFGIVAAAALVGAITGYSLWVLIFALAAYLVVFLWHLYQLHRWLINKKKDELPDAGGVWGEAFDEIRKLERETQRRKDRLAGMVERFQSAAGAMPDATVVLSSQDEIEWANQAAERLLGLHWPRDHKQRILNLIRNPDFASYLRTGEFSEALQLPSPIIAENTVSLQIIPFGSSDKLLIARDMTHLVRLEEMRSQFVANVSHELRTPVTVLMGFVEILEGMSRIERDELQQHLSTMHEQVVRMQRLVDDLLALSRLETSPPHLQEEAVDIPAMLPRLKDQAAMFGMGKQHQITVEAEAELKLYGNEEELHSAFSNLVNNAVRYTPAGGNIHLRWAAHPEGAIFSVTDTGEGISQQHIPHLTERFYRVDSGRSRATGGTGLGLSIVKHVLLRHEAKLQVESGLGQGSTFSCIFPSARILAERAQRSHTH